MKLYQCGYSAFIYELFQDKDGTIRATKTSVRNGKLCLEKTFSNETLGREWIIERNTKDQEFTLAVMRLAGKSEDC